MQSTSSPFFSSAARQLAADPMRGSANIAATVPLQIIADAAHGLQRLGADQSRVDHLIEALRIAANGHEHILHYTRVHAESDRDHIALDFDELALHFQSIGNASRAEYFNDVATDYASPGLQQYLARSDTPRALYAMLLELGVAVPLDLDEQDITDIFDARDAYESGRERELANAMRPTEAPIRQIVLRRVNQNGASNRFSFQDLVALFMPPANAPVTKWNALQRAHARLLLELQHADSPYLTVRKAEHGDYEFVLSSPDGILPLSNDAINSIGSALEAAGAIDDMDMHQADYLREVLGETGLGHFNTGRGVADAIDTSDDSESAVASTH